MIRQATEKDLDQVLTINNRFVPMVSQIDRAWLEKYLREGAEFSVFTEGELVVGYVVGMLPGCDYGSENFRWFTARYKDFLYVDRIAVDAAAHGKGVGKALYDSVFSRWKGRIPAVTCEVNIRPENPISLGFHHRLGFREVGQQETKGGSIRVSMLWRDL